VEGDERVTRGVRDGLLRGRTPTIISLAKNQGHLGSDSTQAMSPYVQGNNHCELCQYSQSYLPLSLHERSDATRACTEINAGREVG